MNPIYKELVIKDDEKGLMSILFFFNIWGKTIGYITSHNNQFSFSLALIWQKIADSW
jgi:hypothetical protein